MRKFPRLILIYIIIIAISSCKKDEIEEAPKIACPIFVLEGPDYLWHDIGMPWNEPGFHCSELEIGGDDLTGSVIVDNTELDVNSPGIYEIKYTAVNKLGCKKSVSRWVLINSGDPAPDITGVYTKNFGTQVMTITQGEAANVFEIGQIFDQNVSSSGGSMFYLSGYEFRVFKDFFKTTINGDLYYEGIALYDISNNTVTFYISTYFYEDDTHYTDYQITWYKS